MLDRLHQENLRLRRGFRALTREAEKNAAIFHRFHTLELSLLDAASLPELLERIVHKTRDILGLDEVTLIVHDPEHEVRNLLECNGVALPTASGVRLTDGPTSGNPAYVRRKGPWLGPYREDHAELFRSRGGFGSIALLPLVAQGRPFGSLNLASADPVRYTGSHGSDFHDHLASVASLCLQNAINRERLVVSGHTDRLTGWHNRHYLDARLPQEVSRALRYREPLSCLILDLDHFKQINDRYGHPSGDRVLRETAGRIKCQLRSSDLAVRYGGEEFVVFLVQATEGDAFGVAERIRRCIADAPYLVLGDQRLSLTVSGGIAQLQPVQGQVDPAALGAAMLQQADAALYRAKSAGRNRVARHSRA